MAKKIKIGIPRALLYYRYGILWKTFFEKLNCNVILSPNTTKEIINKGISLAIDESCLSFKIYLGHVNYLVDKCDYVIIPRIVDYGKGEKVCVKFNGIYDIIKNIYPDLKILNYNLERTKHKYEFFEFVKMGLFLKKSFFKTCYSYYIAKKKEKRYNQELINNQVNKLKSNKLKILVIAHPYNIYDKYIGENIIKILNNYNLDTLYADRTNRKESKLYAKTLSSNLYWSYSKELIGAIKYYENIIDGIIFISTFPCGVDSLVNELMIRKVNNIPKLNIIIDSSTTDVGLQTRIESFIDLIKEKHNNE